MAIDIEISHGKARPPRARVSDVGDTAKTDRRRNRNHDAKGRWTRGNNGASGSRSKAVITKAAAKRALAAQAKDVAGEELSVDDRLALDTLQLYRDAQRRDLDHDGPMVLAPAFRWAMNETLAARLHQEAIEAGITTDQGRALLKLAHDCEQRAERAEAMALAADKRASGRRGRRKQSPIEALRASVKAGRENNS